MRSEKAVRPFDLKLILRWLPGFFLSFLAIYALIKLVPVDQAIEVLSNTPFYYYLLAALFTLLFLLIRTLGWRALLGFQPTYKETFLKLSIGYFINNIFPFRLGEISRALFMSTTMKVNPGKVLSSIFLERVFDLIILAIFLLLMLPYVIGMAWVKTTAWVILGGMIIGLVFLWLLIQNSTWFESNLIKISNKSTIFKKLVVPFFLSILDGFKSINHPKQLFYGFLGIIFSWIVSFVQYSLFLFMMTGTSKWWWGAFANTSLALGIALPSAPAGLGLYESAIVAGLKLFQIDESIALAFALIMHISQFMLIAFLGVYALNKDGSSFKNLYSQLINLRSQLNGKTSSGD